ncbi:hypothetical protein COCCADRAFT_89582 [Bipolaris zeicola 26-R-13]|uniref:Uncharacterized protein n=1 Tax=Cochliobolus carbonum (strain 26-R-13) TaxID=930089 RepID=W6YE27_COCC2|nr:uncharacterized protein COCCADRAFT_89582 [Bipolaris zeicola 26-R-13]EUC35923.1 hypothetical protein COCCADRAFT_89582 [Bipolaris zeicola 26-R-13]
MWQLISKVLDEIVEIETSAKEIGRNLESHMNSLFISNLLVYPADLPIIGRQDRRCIPIEAVPKSDPSHGIRFSSCFTACTRAYSDMAVSQTS